MLSYPKIMRMINIKIRLLCLKMTRVLNSLFILIIATSTSFAQDDSTLHRVKALDLPVLKSNLNVYYSSGYKKRGKVVKSYIQDAMRFYKKKLNITTDLSLAVLTRSNWEQITKIPFDIPFASDSPHVVLLPANLGEGVITSGAGKTKHLAKAETLQELKSAGYTFEQAEMKYVDFIGLHELGHLIAEKLEISFYPGKPNKWYNEFLASYIAYAYLREKNPALATMINTLTEHYIGTMPMQRYTSLEDFEKLYSNVGPENYGWYQNKFFQLVVKIYDRKGLNFIKELVSSSFPKKEKTSIESLLQNLEKITPGFISWEKELK